ERDNLIELPLDLFFSHAEYRAIEEDVLTPGQLWMKTRAHFEQAADLPVNLHAPTCRLRYARENFQQCALARAIASDYTDDLSQMNVEADVTKRPNGLLFVATIKAGTPQPLERRAQTLREQV